MKKQFKPLNLSGVPRKTLNVSSFSGIDLSTPKFKITDGHAVDSLNFIFKDNVLQKRNGYEELFKIKPLTYLMKDFNGNIDLVPRTNDINFNGIWSFIAEDGQTHIIAHIGKLLYEIKDNDFIPIYVQKNTVTGEGGRQYHVCYEYENYKSTAIVGDYKLWFLGGNKFMCIRFFINGEIKVEPVEDSEQAYIPTTTISITYNDSKASGRQSLDNVNLLSTYRKNKLISGTYKQEVLKSATNYFEYPLDSPVITKNEDTDMAKFHITIEERGVIDNG